MASAMDIQPYGSSDPYHHNHSHTYPNSHSYSYGYQTDAPESDKPQNKGLSGALKRMVSRRTEDEAEAQRRRRVSKYKRFDTSRRVKESVRKSVRWFRVRCFKVVYRWW